MIKEMRARHPLGLWSLIFTLLSVSPALAEKEKPKSGCIAEGCHAVLMNAKVVHSAIEDGACDGCHTPSEGSSPDQAGAKHKFEKIDVGQACGDCHEAAKDKSIHKPYGEAKCTACHNPHSSDQPALLREESPALCQPCHEKIAAISSRGSSDHLVADGKLACLSCHEGHLSKIPKLLRKSPKELCLGCHNKEISTPQGTLVDIAGKLTDKKATVHDPVADGCVSCHNPHGSELPRLLVRSYPTAWYGNPSISAYGLCFECHEAAGFEAKETEEGTAFRNGKKNLHAVHILNDPLGRSCSACHDVHAAAGEHLIPSQVPFFGFLVPTNFKTAENGGSCFPGCHEARAYDRLEAVPLSKPDSGHPKP
ncbi:MAG TPA: cytochrome c3 family protein [Bdellovibrionota bacterium]|nr:cytochrome c3 family protein [Bdellovibrionota bacterium]